MKSVHFGFGKPFGSGAEASVALNRRGNVVLVNEASDGEKHYRVGHLSQATVNWGESKPAASGLTPRVALNNNDIAVEVHNNDLHEVLYCRVGRLVGDEVTWPNARSYAEGKKHTRPVVALNDAGVVVEVHEVHEGRGIWPDYGVGQVKEAGGELYVDWSEKRVRGHPGDQPCIAINNHGLVVKVYRSGGNKLLYYTVGPVKGKTIDFPTPTQIRMPNGTAVNGHYPSVALTDDGLVIVVLRDRTKVSVLELIGQVSADKKSVTWNRWWNYDDGTLPSVAAAGTMAIEVHQHEGLRELRFSTSLITDRASWMHHRLNTLGRKRLGDLVLPASHDAGMYKTVSDVGRAWAKTQNLSIYEQLSYGVRYFDLRPKWTGKKFVIVHGDWTGPDLSEVLGDIRKFALENHKELAILTFSHFDNIDNARYDNLVDQIRASIGEWLFKSRPGGRRLADVTLDDYVKKGPAFLVVVDGNYAIDVKREGFWVFRNWYAAPAEDDLRVFDIYANTDRFALLRNDQFYKFLTYDGTMAQQPKEPCDLFLLSWTLTPQKCVVPPAPSVWALARRSNPSLGQDIRLGHPLPDIPNANGKIFNLLSVDYVESARVTDVALFLNGERVTAADEAKPRPRAKAKARRPTK